MLELALDAGHAEYLHAFGTCGRVVEKRRGNDPPGDLCVEIRDLLRGGLPRLLSDTATNVCRVHTLHEVVGKFGDVPERRKLLGGPASRGAQGKGVLDAMLSLCNLHCLLCHVVFTRCQALSQEGLGKGQ